MRVVAKENDFATGIILQCLQIFLNALRKILNALQIFASSIGSEHGVFKQFLNTSQVNGKGEEMLLFLLQKIEKTGFALCKKTKNAKKTRKKATPF